MFGIGIGELLLIMLVALIVVGPKNLPEVARTLARVFGQLRRAGDDLKHDILLAAPLDDVKALQSEVKEVKREIVEGVIARGDSDRGEHG